VIALEVAVPDSGAVEIGDTLRPRARALNGRGDSVAAEIVWASLDTATVVFPDSLQGRVLGKQQGVGRIQARVGNLRSSPLTVRVQTAADSMRTTAALRDTVHVQAVDSLSDSLAIEVWATPPEAANLLGRRVTYAITTYPPGVLTVTLQPRDTVLTAASGTVGVAVARVRLTAGPPPDSVVVTAVARRADGMVLPGGPITFVVEFQP
jgi:hypothetical protein